MGKDVGDERIERLRLAFGFDLNGVGADVAYEPGDVIARRSSADGFAKENALNASSDL